MENDFSKVKLSRLEQLIVHVKKDLGVRRDDIEIPMEYIITALFPDAYNNIKEALTQEYIRGYKEGRKSILEDDGK